MCKKALLMTRHRPSRIFNAQPSRMEKDVRSGSATASPINYKLRIKFCLRFLSSPISSPIQKSPSLISSTRPALPSSCSKIRPIVTPPRPTDYQAPTAFAHVTSRALPCRNPTRRPILPCVAVSQSNIARVQFSTHNRSDFTPIGITLDVLRLSILADHTATNNEDADGEDDIDGGQDDNPNYTKRRTTGGMIPLSITTFEMRRCWRERWRRCEGRRR